MELIEISKGVYYGKYKSGTFLFFEPERRVIIDGRTKLKVLKGKIFVFGVCVNPYDPAIDLYNIRGVNAFLPIEGITHQVMGADVLNCDEFKNLDKKVVTVAYDTIVENRYENYIICLLIGLETKVTEAIRAFGTTGTSVMPNSIYGKTNGFTFLNETELNDVSVFNNNEDWNSIFSSLDLATQAQHVVSIFGGKATGKSTFNRWLINRWLSNNDEKESCYFVDLDPGQSEFTPPGVLSVVEVKQFLFGPNFTHYSKTMRSIYLGSVSVADSAKAYLVAIKLLADFLANLPPRKLVLINTMGFVSGLGADLAVETIRMFKPTWVVQLCSVNMKNNFSFALNGHNVANYQGGFAKASAVEVKDYAFSQVDTCVLPSSNIKLKNTSGLRELAMVSYFGMNSGGEIFQNRPKRISLKHVAIRGVTPNSTDPEILQALLGNLIGLYKLNTVKNWKDMSTQCGRVFIVVNSDGNAKSNNNFYGYAMVHGFSETKNELLVYSPVEENLLEEINCMEMAGGEIVVPHLFYKWHQETTAGSELPFLAQPFGRESLHGPAARQFVPKRSHF